MDDKDNEELNDEEEEEEEEEDEYDYGDGEDELEGEEENDEEMEEEEKDTVGGLSTTESSLSGIMDFVKREMLRGSTTEKYKHEDALKLKRSKEFAKSLEEEMDTNRDVNSKLYF